MQQAAQSGWSVAERGTLTVVSIAHFISHFHLLALPPLFPPLIDQLGLTVGQLAWALTVLQFVSLLVQTPMGYAVDRFGARPVLIGGLLAAGGGLAWFGLHPGPTTLLAAAVLLGLANGVYHPANYDLLHRSIDERRMGRAFSVHTFAGYLGGALAPAIMLGLAHTLGLGPALVAAGLAALVPVAALALVRGSPAPAAPAAARTAEAARPAQVFSPTVLLLVAFFVLLSLSSGGLQNFAVLALDAAYGVSLATANAALTAYLLASAFGVLAGGYIADRTSRHAEAASLCFAVTTPLVALVGLVALPPLVLLAVLGVAGFFFGMISPSRDMMVRAAAPPGAVGRVFAIVSTGFNIGGAVGPLLFAALLRGGHPRLVFIASAVFMVLTVILTLAENRRIRHARHLHAAE